jgi:SRSO17 transposase
VAVTLSLANRTASLPVAYRLYLPQEWADDPARRKKAGVPEDITFQTKPEIALDQIRAAAEAGLPPGVILMDAGYGSDTQLRTSVTALGFRYIAGILSNTSVWAHGRAPLPPKPWSGRGRPPKLVRRDGEHQPTSVKALALALAQEMWTEISWREGAADWLTSRFARIRVRAAHRDYWLGEPRPQEWLLIEWPEGDKEPTKYWLSTLPEDIGFERLVELAKLRWRIERDYQELKQELGLGHYEGRGWRGFHHHASLCIAAYGFLVAERARISPSGCAAPMFTAFAVPAGDRPRGASNPTGAARAELNRNHAQEAHGGPGPKTRAMSVLCNPDPQASSSRPFVTQ